VHTVTYDFIALIAITLMLLALQRAGSTALAYRGTHVITCPETGEPAAVGLAVAFAALTATFRNPLMRVQTCSGWPERHACNQACLREIRTAPDESLVPNLVARWCRDQSCVCCGTAFEPVPTGRHQPWLMSPERQVFESKQVLPQKLPEALRTCGPVCWTCLMAETHTW